MTAYIAPYTRVFTVAHIAAEDSDPPAPNATHHHWQAVL